MSATVTTPELTLAPASARTEAAAGVRRFAWLVPLSLFVLAVALYANTASFDLMYSWDDNRYVTDNPLLRDPSIQGVIAIFTQEYFAAYIPVTILTYWIEWQLWGNWAAGYHIVNILLNAANAVLVFYFIRRLLKKHWVAVLAAVLWIVHPLQVETVAWVSQHKNTVSAFFTLCAFLLHMRSSADDRKKGDLIWAYLAYLAAALSKPAVVGVPVLFVLYDLFWMKMPLRRAVLRNLIPLAIGAFAAVLIVITHDRGGGIKPYRGNSIVTTAQLMLIVYWDYLVNILWPFDLNNRYWYPPNLIQEAALSMWLGLGLILATIWFVWKQPLGRPYSAYAAAWVWLFLLPVSNIVPINIERADRYMYFPLIIVFAGVALGIERIWNWAGRRIQAARERGETGDDHQMIRYATLAILGVVIGMWALATVDRSWVWRDEGALWSDHLIDYPFSETGLLNLGVFYFNEQRYEEAEETFRTMLNEYYPNHWKANRFMGHVMMNTGRAAEAVNYYAAAAQVAPEEPSNFYYLAQALYETRNYGAAVERYRNAYSADPNLPVQGLLNMGQAALQIGDYRTALEAYATAEARIGSSNPTVQAQIASSQCAAQAELGDLEGALVNCQESIQLDPTNGMYFGRLAHVLMQAGRPADALTVAQSGIRAQPNLSVNHRVAGDAYLALGDTASARTAYESALQIDPNNRRAREGLAALNGTGPTVGSAPAASADDAVPAHEGGVTITETVGEGVGETSIGGPSASGGP
ncbi:MAG: tetratricopeptide repeat protein [Anaerolinea sp.]|nr:tetratricopeptide repeat protein [Anaerolinea sp.]